MQSIGSCKTIRGKSGNAAQATHRELSNEPSFEKIRQGLPKRDYFRLAVDWFWLANNVAHNLQ
jgi:hypothetical protein